MDQLKTKETTETIDKDDVEWVTDTDENPSWGNEVSITADKVASPQNQMMGFVKSKNGPLFAVVSLILILILVLATQTDTLNFWSDDDKDTDDNGEPVDLELNWNEPVWLPRNPVCVDANNGQDFPEFAIGYEPSIAVDSQGNLYYTAHKDLRWCAPGGGPLSGSPFPPGACIPNYFTTWDYYASWFFVSQDGGLTWGPPNDWGTFNYGSQYGGDEGDIGVDADDRVYYLDTTLEDNWLHVFDNGGDDYVMGKRLQSSSFDDRPWLTAQGSGIVHYLGNNGVSLPAPDGAVGRYWYYRSDDGGMTFTLGKGLPGGWAHIEVERYGNYAYIVQENSDGNSGGIKMWISDNQGVSWNDPIPIGGREGNPPEGFPWVSVGPNGTVAASWAGVTENGTWEVHIAMSWDHGQTWANWTVTPFKGAFMYPNVYVGPDNTLAMAFYGLESEDGHLREGDEWHLYAGMVQNSVAGQEIEFVRADPEPLHIVTAAEESNNDFHALQDFFEIAISPVDLSLNIAYQYNRGEHPFEPGEEQRYLMYVRGSLEEE